VLDECKTLDVLACGYLSKQAERGTMPTSRLMMQGSARLISFCAKESMRMLSKRWRPQTKRTPNLESTSRDNAQRSRDGLHGFGEGQEDRDFTIPMQTCDLRWYKQ
jgi:hypothetical protein